MKKLVFPALILLLVSLSPVRAGNSPQEIIVVSEERPNAINRDGTGLYCDILRAVYESLGIKTRMVLRSYDGSVSLVKQHKADAAVGLYPDATSGTVFSKYPFVKDAVLVLFKKDKSGQWEGQQTLKNQRVGWISGCAYNEYLEVPVTGKEFHSRETMLRWLDEDRIDFYMDSRKDVEAVLNKGIIDVTQYTVETVLELERYLVFADSLKGNRLKRIFDRRFPYLVQTGEIEKLHDKWNW